MNETPDELTLEIGGLQIQPGDRIGPYVYRHLIGKGGMANVVMAIAPDGEEVALKILKSNRMGTGLQRFRREFKALARLRHPNVIRVDNYADLYGHPYIAMERIQGTDLHHTIHSFKEPAYRDNPQIRWERCIEILTDLCRALAYIHRRGLVHRDLKPSNVLITQDGTCKLTDFGIVKDLDRAWTDPLVSTTLVGTWAYASPEQIAGQPIDHRSDLYSLGVILFAMLTGKRPFVAKDLAGYIELHRTHRAPAPSDLDTSIPPLLDEICQRLLRKLPKERYRSAEEILYRLENQEENSFYHGSTHHSGPTLPLPLPMSGRHHERDRIQERVSALTRSQGGIMLIEGMEGMGRSRLLEGAAEVAAAIGLPCLRFPDQPGFSIPEGPSLVLIDDISRITLAQTPLLIELVRASRESAEGTDHAIGHSVLLIATLSRENRSRLRTLLEDRAEVLSLQGLSELEVEELCATLIGSGRGANELGKRLYRETSGWPSYIDAYIRAMRAQDLLIPSKSGPFPLRLIIDIEDLESGHLEIPHEVRQRVHEQTRKMSQEAQTMAEVIAVAGMKVDLDTILDALDIDEDVANTTLAQLQRLGLVHGATSGWLEWNHPKYRDVLYQELEEDRRASIHRTLAAVLMERFRDSPNAAEVVGEHFRLAGEVGKAFQQLVDAAARAIARGQAEAALGLVEQAEEIEDQARVDLVPSEYVFLKRQLLEHHAEACQIRGEWEEARDLLEQALGVERLLDEASRLRIQLQLARALMRLSQTDRAEELANEVLAGARERHDRDLVIDTIQVLSGLAWGKGDLDRCEALAQEGLLLATTPVKSRAALLVSLTSVQACRGQLNLAATGLQEAHMILRDLNLLSARAVVLANLSEVQLGQGELRAAWESVDEALSAATDCGHRLAEAACHRVRGMILASAGVYAEARSELVAGMTLSQELSAAQEVSAGAFYLARLCVEEGKLAEANEWLELGRKAVLMGDPEHYGAALGAERALVLALEGRTNEAQALLGSELPEQLPARLPALRRVEVLLDQARCWAALGASTRALQLAREAMGLANLRGFRTIIPEIYAFIGWFSPNARERELAARGLVESLGLISDHLPLGWLGSLQQRLGLGQSHGS